MSVKKMGSKLAQGVRQIKAQQVKSSAIAEAPSAPPAEPTPAAGVAKPAPARAAVKRAAAKVSPSSTLHPSRVWPD